MKAIEFKTIVENNGLIQIPEEYLYLCQGEVKVIILKKENINTKNEVEQQYAKVIEIINQIQD